MPIPEEVVTQIVVAMFGEVMEIANKYKGQMSIEDQNMLADLEQGIKDIHVEEYSEQDIAELAAEVKAVVKQAAIDAQETANKIMGRLGCDFPSENS